MKKTLRITITVLMIVSVMTVLLTAFASSAARTSSSSIQMTDEVAELMENATTFILVRHKQLGNSHYAYTDSISDHGSWGYNEYSYYGGSSLSLVTLSDNGDGTVKVTEKTLINSSGGILRDPDVSEDGTRFVFSWKQNENDDFHIYEYDLVTEKRTQLTFGSGVADVEPVYTAKGTIMFNSTRDIQTVDCWYTPVMNMYVMNADGSDITRVGFDQVHTTYATSTTDGRIIYTRWDYNDRNQMFVQALYQMFPDGSNQTELYGNNVNNPTTLLHTREIPGAASKYVTIISGHHMYQVGKLAVLDVSEGRNDMSAVQYLNPDSQTRQLSSAYTQNVDSSLFQEGTVYKYPYAYSENVFTVAMSKTYQNDDKRESLFDIVLMNKKGKTTTLVAGKAGLPASQFVPVMKRDLFNRESVLNYNNSSATYYMANVYMGEGMEGVKAGSAKYLRIVALSFRPYSIGATNGVGTGSSDPYSPIATGNGAWDVKQVLGIVDIYDDGSALFTIPAGVPVYFQVLDENGLLIQTMRSWTTAQNGEYFSCVGCHLDKNTAPPTTLTTTKAMKAGVQSIKPDKWMSVSDTYKDYDPYNTRALIGFDYLDVVQPIFDSSCNVCHSNSETSYTRIRVTNMENGAAEKAVGNTILATNEEWQFTKTEPAADWYKTGFNSSSWSTAHAPFGMVTTNPGRVNTVWKDSDTLWLRKNVQISEYDVGQCSLQLNLAYTKNITVYVNGTEVYSSGTAQTSLKTVVIDEKYRSAFVEGENVIAVKVEGSSSGRYFALGLLGVTAQGGAIIGTEEFIGETDSWKYYTSADDELGSSGNWTAINFDDSAWSSHAAPLGNRDGRATGTDWTGDSPYIWARKTFTVDEIKNFDLTASMFFDDDIKIYLNGNLIFEEEGWNDKITDYAIDNAEKYLVKGKNVIAVSLHQHTGGYEFLMSLKADVLSGAKLTSNASFSLEGYSIYAPRMQKYFPLSYLVLTGSTPNSNDANKGNEWIASHSGNTAGSSYVNFISSMSQCEVLKPYAGGSTKSNIIKKLQKGHGELSDAEIAAVACWIDLAAPCFGSYEPEGYTNWTNDNQKAADEQNNMRDYFDMLDRCAKMSRAGNYDGEITIKYGSSASASGKGYAVLYLTKQFAANTTVTVTLPKGEKYLGFSMQSRVGEAIIYCPSGTYTYKIPRTAASVFPSTFMSYSAPQISARVVTEEEYKSTRNIARNPYDLDDATGAFPHVTASTVVNQTVQNAPRNAIDGFTANKGQGTWPLQAWQPGALTDTDYWKIDFGRSVEVSELIIRVRAAGSDGNIASCVAEFSDGTKVTLDLTDTGENQHFEIDKVTTTYVKLTNFVLGSTKTQVAITEVEVMGKDK